ncbi:MAG: DsbA family protein [Thermodesulfobacteriota bacterium]
MKIRRVGAALIFCMIMALPLTARSETPIKGSYIELPGYSSTFDGKTVEIIEFMSFYCGHCYKLERWIPVIRGNFPKKIRWKTLPMYWGKGSSKPGEAYLIAVDSGKGEELKAAIFHANFVDHKDIGSIELLEKLAGEVGLGFDFSMKLRGGEKADEAREALKLANAYGLTATPTLILDSNIMTSPTMTGPDMTLFVKNTTAILKGIFKR